jgi:basigin
VSNITVTDVGEYQCYDENGQGLKTFTHGNVAEPVIKNTRESVTYHDGDINRTLTCWSNGSYPNVAFQWFFKEKDAAESDDFVELSESVNIQITAIDSSSSVLKFVNNLTYDQAGYYRCDVSNVAGVKSVEVNLRVKDKLAALWPFLGIVAEVLILIIVIFVYEHNTTKKRMATTNMDSEEMEALNMDSKADEEIEIRQRNNNHK